MPASRRNYLDTGMNGSRRIASAVGIVVWIILGVGVWFLDTKTPVKIVISAVAIIAVATLGYAYTKLNELKD